LVVTQAVEDYLKVIYKLQKRQEEGESVQWTDEKVTTLSIADRMGLSAASVTNMVKKLAEMKLVRYTPYQGVELTASGEKIALEVIRHHRLIELYLAEALGYSWDRVDTEAERLEHVISEEFEEKIDSVLGYPTVDPHGAPIPTKGGVMKEFMQTSLSDLEPGQTAVICQVSDRDPDILRYLTSLGFALHIIVEILEKAPFNGPLLVRVGEQQRMIGLDVAKDVFVTLPSSGKVP
jgi:DtxR family Mn-dependent transcriptional regulator